MSLNFNHFAAEANEFLNKYTKDLNLYDTDQAGRILSSILHGLRDIIPMEESLQLIAQFPMFLKAVYVNGWTSRKKKLKIRTMTEFIDLVRKHNGKTSVHDLGSDEMSERYINLTFILLRRYISLGEMEDIRTDLPKNLKSMVYQNIMFQ